MDITKQVVRRTVRMGGLYLVIGVAMGIGLTYTFGIIPSSVGNINTGGQAVDIVKYLSYMAIPFTGLVALIASTPVYMLFVFDKNAGVLEYLLAVGMTQREVFKGYWKAALMMGGVVMVPPVLIDAATHGASLVTLEVAVLGVTTGVAAVSLVTVLMTAFSSMQRKPTGMNSPLGIGVGVFAIMPEMILGAVLGEYALVLDAIVGVAILVVALLMLLSIDRLIMREKLLP